MGLASAQRYPHETEVLSGGRVLLIEDELIDVLRATHCLEWSLDAPQIRIAHTFSAGIELLGRHSFDVAVVDLGLPDVAREEVIPRVRSAAPDIVLIVLTGEDSRAAQKILRLGADDFIPKADLDGPSLARAIRHARERAAMRRETAAQTRRLEEMRAKAADAERLAAIGRVAAGVAHEVNNPATFIMSNLEASLEDLEMLESDLRGHPVLSRVEQSLTDALDGIRRIASVVGTLGTTSRVHNDGIELVDIDAVVDVACGIFAPHFRYGVELVRNSDRPRPLAAVRTQLVQIVSNLVDNAVQAVQSVSRGKHRIEVAVKSTSTHVTIFVRDDGPGVPDTVKARVFEAFFTTKGKSGTGLGLSISSELALAHRGRLELDSMPGGGTEARLVLPYDNGLMLPNQGSPVLALPSGGKRSRTRVLLVDDEPLVRNGLSRLLNADFEVSVAAEGSEALALLEADPTGFDVILCDLAMPGMDGPALYDTVADWRPGLLQRFVFMTGGAFTERTREFVRDVDATMLRKPLARRELEEALENAAKRPALPLCELLVPPPSMGA